VSKQVVIFFSLFALLCHGCGQESRIKNNVQAESLANAYGDGKYVIRNLTFPLSDSSLAYRTPLPGIGPIAGGILRFVGDVFAANTNMGKLQLSYTQPIPELPRELHSVRLKRFFFYMKPQEQQRRFRDWFSHYLLGKDHVTFDFLDKLAVRLETVRVENPETYLPTLTTKDYDRKEMRELMEVFSSGYRGTVVDTEKAWNVTLIRYSRASRSGDTALKDYGPIFVLETVQPQQTKHFFLDHPKLKGFFRRILILDDSLLIELEKDPVVEEAFKIVMGEVAQELEQLKVTFIDECTPDSCLELRLPDVNLIPIARKGNAIKLDAVIHAGKVPESFNLKGFVEFEVKVATPNGV
jgi:hypothetical protein